jgi:murein DD-endopeptidase MepM/ murein hydrolase activator NlpD
MMLNIDRDYLPPAQIALPFSAKSKPALVIEEGYLYSEHEKAIHGLLRHYGIDFGLPLGTPVFASRDGYVLQSEHIDFTDAVEGRPSVGFGLGNFVAQLCFADNGNPFYLTYAHLSKVEGAIPRFDPKWEGDGSCDPVVLYQDIADFQAKCRKISRGELIGAVGVSGLAKAKGNLESWDDPHLHMECFTRIPPHFSKDPTRRLDPFDLYQEVAAYRGALKRALGKHDLWMRDETGACLYAAV